MILLFLNKSSFFPPRKFCVDEFTKVNLPVKTKVKKKCIFDELAEVAL
jgi:hypothetical protein